MKNVYVNGELMAFSGSHLADLIEQISSQQTLQKPFAVAVNTQFIAKNDYAKTLLAEHDCVDIVRPVVGG